MKSMNQANTQSNLFLFFFKAGIISLLDEEEPQLKVRTGCRVVDQVPEEELPYRDNLMSCMFCWECVFFCFFLLTCKST